jgi:hypothetical protein
MLVWPATFLVLVFKRFKKSWLIAWLAAATASIALYYTDYHETANGLSKTSFLNDLVAYGKYYLAYIGRPISDNPQTAVLAGAYVLTVFAALAGYMLYKKRLNVAAIACFGGIGLINGLLAVMARFDWGIAAALSSRYTAFSLLLIIAIIIMGAALSQREPGGKVGMRPTHVAIIMLIVVMPAVIFSWNSGLKGMKERSKLYKYIYTCSREKQPTHTCLYEIFFPSTEVAKERLDYLKKKHYGGY